MDYYKARCGPVCGNAAFQFVCCSYSVMKCVLKFAEATAWVNWEFYFIKVEQSFFRLCNRHVTLQVHQHVGCEYQLLHTPSASLMMTEPSMLLSLCRFHPFGNYVNSQLSYTRMKLIFVEIDAHMHTLTVTNCILHSCISSAWLGMVCFFFPSHVSELTAYFLLSS